MRYSISIAALSLSSLHSASANPHIARVFNDFAPRAFYPEGNTPKDVDTFQPDVSRRSSSSPSSSAKRATNSSITPSYVELPIDHFGNGTVNGTSTFWNRYWVDDEYYREGGPVFVYDVGELDGDNRWSYFLTNESSYLRGLERKFGGLGIVWEHRYCELWASSGDGREVLWEREVSMDIRELKG